MSEFLKPVKSLASDTLGGRGGRIKLRILCLKLSKLLEHHIVFIVRDSRGIVFVIQSRIVRNLLAQINYSFARLFLSHILTSIN